MRYAGKTNYLCLGRGNSNEGIWLGEKQIPSFIRKKDVFLEYLRKYLSATILISIDCDDQDRIITISYQKWGVVNKAAFFYMGRKLYFAHHYYDAKSEHMKVFKSWTQEKIVSDNLSNDIFNEVGRQKQSEYREKSFIEIEELLEQENKKALSSSSETKKKKFLKRKVKNIENDLLKVGKKEDILKFIETTENLEKLDKVLLIDDIKIKFKEKSHYVRRDQLYQKIKNFKKAEKILKVRLKDTQSELEGHNLRDLRKSELVIVKPIWRNEKKKSIESSGEGNIQVFSFEEMELGVGINAQGNDRLRKQWAKKDDYWFHLEGDRSAHIIIKLKENTLSDDIFGKVAAAMVKYSQIERTEVQMIYTMVKNVKGVTGAAGKVTFKKEKHIKIFNFPAWDNIINPTED